jgi:hypothetical protein
MRRWTRRASYVRQPAQLIALALFVAVVVALFVGALSAGRDVAPAQVNLVDASISPTGRVFDRVDQLSVGMTSYGSQVPYLLILVLIVAVGIILLVFMAIRLRASLRRFGMVRGWLEDQLTDRAGMLRARSAALAIAVEDLRRPAIQQDASRIISNQDR